MTPEDINKTAWEVWARARLESMCADQVAILAAALVAERERCAKIADEFPDIVMQLVEHPGGPPGNFVRGLRGSDIASAIRNPQTP